MWYSHINLYILVIGCGYEKNEWKVEATQIRNKKWKTIFGDFKILKIVFSSNYYEQLRAMLINMYNTCLYINMLDHDDIWLKHGKTWKKIKKT